MSNRLNISRDQLAKFLGNDADLIRRFENLFSEVGEILPEDLESLRVDFSAEISRQSGDISALKSCLDRIASSLEALPPSIELKEVQDDLNPVNHEPIEAKKELTPYAKRVSYTATNVIASTVNTPLSINYDLAQDLLEGHTVPNTNRLVISEDGTYKIDCFINVVSDVGIVDKSAWFWFRKNGADIAPAIKLDVTADKDEIVNLFTLLKLEKDDYIQVYMLSNTANLRVDTSNISSTPPVPASLLTVIKVN